MDDVFDEYADERVIIEKDHKRLQENFHTMGVKEGILEKKFVQDENVVKASFIKGFNEAIEVKRVVGRLSMIEYITGKLLPQDKEEVAQVSKQLNELIDKVGKEENKVLAERIDSLVNDMKKFVVEP